MGLCEVAQAAALSSAELQLLHSCAEEQVASLLCMLLHVLAHKDLVDQQKTASTSADVLDRCMTSFQRFCLPSCAEAAMPAHIAIPASSTYDRMQVLQTCTRPLPYFAEWLLQVCSK